MFYELTMKDYECSISTTLENQSIETAFRKLNHNSIGFYKWRVDNQRIESVPKDQYDTFNDNYVYIIYAATPRGTFVNKDTINRDSKSNIQLDKYIHFWLGNAATQQDSGNVSYKVMELDNHLGNLATQYRETQENESDRFLSYFKDGIIIRSINCSHSNNVSLFHVNGKCSPKCVERTVQWDAFSSEFVMVLKTSVHIFIWIGRSSEESERLNGLKFAKQFHDNDKHLELVVVNDGYEQSMNERRKADWCIHLPLSNRRVKPLGKFIENHTVSPLKLYQCGFVGGKYRIEEKKSSFVDQSDFNDKNSAFIVDCAKKGVWIWLGRNCSPRDKSEAMRNARGFVRKKQYPSNVLVIRTVDGFEPNEFRNLFPFWCNTQAIGNKMKNVLGRIDTKILSERASLAAETQLIDDGGGDVMIYKVGKSNLVKVPKRYAQCLFSTESYVIHYTLMIPENNLLFEQPSVRHILYLWVGKQCPSNTKDIGEKLSNELFQHLQKNVMQIRLNDGFESPHFLQIFRGKLIVFDGESSAEESKLPKVFILKVTGNSTFNSRATQITQNATFSSKDCVIVKSYDSVWVWCGQGSTGDAREVAKTIGGTIGDYVLVMESSEPEDFWIALPDHWNSKFRKLPNSEEPTYEFKVEKERVRLFVCSFIQGLIKFDQIMAFAQNDLKPEDVFLLDIDCMLYIWIGSSSFIQNGQPTGNKIAELYLDGSILPRHKSLAIAIIQQGFEPSSFIGFFDQWNYKLWNHRESFEEQIVNFTTTTVTPSQTKPKQQDCDFDKYPKYPLDVLRSEIDELPDSVDPKRKEIHLTNDDFVSIFDMNFSEFEMLPNWKKQELKKKFKLF